MPGKMGGVFLEMRLFAGNLMGWLGRQIRVYGPSLDFPPTSGKGFTKVCPTALVPPYIADGREHRALQAPCGKIASRDEEGLLSGAPERLGHGEKPVGNSGTE